MALVIYFHIARFFGPVNVEFIGERIRPRAFDAERTTVVRLTEPNILIGKYS